MSSAKIISHIPLTKLKKGLRAKVVEISSGKQAAHRLSTLGIRLGGYVVKVSAFALKGPVTVKVGSSVIALGHGMAEKVIVELL
ncbi:MAG: FeoA family protein [Candidatus Omnitrophota bacterium]